MASPLVVIAQLFVTPDRDADFEEFESRAVPIMARYGGRIERRVLLETEGIDRPSEVHVVTFPDRGQFELYVADPELKSLAPLRTRAIQKTVVWFGEDLPVFGG